MTTPYKDAQSDGRAPVTGKPEGFATGDVSLLDAVLEAMQDDHIYVIDQEGKLVYISATGARALGWNRAEKLGKSLKETGILTEAVEREARDRPRALAGEIVSSCIRYPTVDGIRDFEYTASPIRDTNGAIKHILIRCHDITERLQNQEHEAAARNALLEEKTLADQESVGQLNSLAEAIPGFVWSAPTLGGADWVNRRYWDYIDCDETVPISESFLAVTHPQDKSHAQEEWTKSQKSGQNCEYEVRIRGKDKSYRWFLSRSTPYRDGEGKILRWFGVTIDIDKQKKAEIELETLNNRLQRAMAETHHRVKNNLQIVASLLELESASYRGTVPKEEMARLTQHIRSLATVHDLLTQEAHRDGNGVLVDARAILEQLLPMLEALGGDKKIVARLSEARIASQQGTSLALISNELIHNAIKHGASCIYVDFSSDDKNATLIVADDGPGFPPNFDPTLSSHAGLELVRHLTQWDLRGEITFGSRPAGGAQVMITLPLPVATQEEWK